ncbi:DUF4397 domain-containing protein [Sinanaerobacter sp. ZZT-01]|uniref:DUF4397 domain-containing protein n=1 Tax=Sinanaerobacter sp. ZZT-01 TaxID=3111540 RepID=UPI002D77A1C0|nr:DUF4397 domain-containing protein [Sinanaerobacter sp. ZZT-01]WRR93046.1 DUF4397 domain-containing protein [Sinanaerobacter sp. ZZT-01]
MNQYKKCERRGCCNNNSNRVLGYFRIFHAHPDAPNVDIYLNDKIISENLPYNSYSGYFPMCCDDYKLTIKMNGFESPPMVVDLLTISENEMQTISLIKTEEKAGLLKNLDDSNVTEKNTSMLRFIHLSPDAPAADLTLPDGTIIFENISYQESTPYLLVPSSSYTLHIRETGTPNVLLTVPDLTLHGEKSYSLNATGLLDGYPKLDSLILLDDFH